MLGLKDTTYARGGDFSSWGISLPASNASISQVSPADNGTHPHGLATYLTDTAAHTS